ncbi:protein GAMETE EXPRESSED 1 isoform X2 [Cucumis melo var. makuwa]|uniref:Protein GAMETE EXPRESSED 1 isoform X2 n=1 Tax=Cucumis melo var. makuwa TaxID=1194695 RepID=A0A5A7T6X8_CUCMM|nr:protein GAMETE EXPRESSED 1 isoform X2 [Cucumis melo var. makuwa]TYK13845.1 protein GAMETE EXPRESSED 1 isoform X2 [Cucumis melo var. makuwa]
MRRGLRLFLASFLREVTAATAGSNSPPPSPSDNRITFSHSGIENNSDSRFPMERVLFLVILLVVIPMCESWGWFSSSPFSESTTDPSKHYTVAKFSMEGFDDRKGVRRIQNAKNKLTLPNSCWESAYRHLFASFSEIFAADEKWSRFGWHLSDCFQKDSGRPPFPSCDPKSSLAECLKYL